MTGASSGYSGSFASITADYSISDSSGDLILTYTGGAAAHVGDTNNDGDVDIFDYLALQADYGTASGATWAMGDFNGDGDVDIFDYLDLQAQYGWTAGGGAPIPEPATMALIGLGGLAVLRRRRRS